ncbi:unnamed protein product [Cladocopium goreaui]|uniref:Uncharacterized protein n=1 Tax=Cladocopium goreaui TaxID=2562237 RepID=A0A9P1GRV4_9DINO|nr:unnamed protein product [Cladocopium goreaui]
MSLPSQDTLPTTCKRAEFGVLQASNPTKQELLLIENVPQALSFKCLRQFSIKSNSRFVSIVLLNWRSVVLCRLNSALSILFIFFLETCPEINSRRQPSSPLLGCNVLYALKFSWRNKTKARFEVRYLTAESKCCVASATSQV